MVCCCAVGCSNRTEKGYRIYNFPADKHRNAQWVKNVNRANWQPSRSSRVCEVHFEEDQFELGRKDGKKLLKPYAVPTLFGKNIRKTKLPTKPLQESIVTPLFDLVASQHDHCYRLTRVPSPKLATSCETNSGSVHNRVVEPEKQYNDENVVRNDDITHSKDTENFIPEESVTLSLQQSPRTYTRTPHHERPKSPTLCDGSCGEKMLRLQNDNDEMALQLAEEKEKSIVREANLRRLFNEDQLEVLSSNKLQNCKRHINWREDTLKKCLEMQCVLGQQGYNYLRDYGFPLPSPRTLLYRLQYSAETLTEEPADVFSCDELSSDSNFEEQGDAISLLFDDPEGFCQAISI